MDSPKLIGQGTHGCAYTPPIPCKRSKYKHKNGNRIVGKVLDKEHAEIELKASALVKAIPGWNRYFIIQEEDDCNSENFKQAEKHDCRVYDTTRLRNLRQLISTYGGSTLHEIAISSSFDFMRHFKHVVDGIALLQKQGICHYDIKDNNILMDERSVLRIIDFGSAFIGEHVSKKNIWLHQYSFLPEYPPQPPELSVQNGLHDDLGYKFSIEETIRKKKIFRTLENLLGVSMETSKRELTKFWMDMDFDTWVPLFHQFWNVWDSWSVGVMFLNILEKCFIHPSFVPVWKEHGPILRQVLKGMLRADPRERLSASEASILLNY